MPQDIQGKRDVDWRHQKFQIKLAGQWRDVADHEDKVLKAAYESGASTCSLSSRGQKYDFDLTAMTQKNTSVAPYKVRHLRHIALPAENRSGQIFSSCISAVAQSSTASPGLPPIQRVFTFDKHEPVARKVIEPNIAGVPEAAPAPAEKHDNATSSIINVLNNIGIPSTVQKRRNAKCKDSNADSAVNPFITVREIMTKSPSNVMSKLMYNPSMEGTKSSRNSDQIAGLLNKLEAENMKAVGNEVDADEKEEVESDPITSVRAVKEKMAELRNIDADSQMYVYGGRQMSDDKSLEDYKVRTGGVISLIMKL
eukprot:GEMP01071231.1.p1 GENE.GEMP01071231.1~~GEMP01071231.1.p1  ORF type:complete len:311 (+),score=67.00 GEMP01071231.1:119-1051(+)